MRSLKIIVLAAALLASAAGLSAQSGDQSVEVISRLSQAFSQTGTYEVRFTATLRGMEPIRGEYVVSGDSFFIDVAGQQQFSDGINRYEVFYDDREVVIDMVNLESRNILSNPTRAFLFAPAEFSSRYITREARAGRECHVILLTPLSATKDATAITLYVDVVSYIPVGIVYNYEGEVVDISIDSIDTNTSVDEALFRFDGGRYPGYDIIDFR